MSITEIQDLQDYVEDTVTLKGWVDNQRSSGKVMFVIVRDGTGFTQCVVHKDKVTEKEFEVTEDLDLEDVIRIKGEVVEDERQIGGYELQVKELERLRKSEEYPIQKKEHGPGFLMDHRHLWLRSRKQWAVMRVRNEIIFAIHNFFQERGFMQLDAPIFTGNAVEGTTDLFETDFFGQPGYLSQSGQLYGEAMAMAQRKIYTFGPTFRAEKSKTRRHLSEFWMIEPEMAFYDLEDTMDLIEDFVRYLIRWVLDKCQFQFELLDRDPEPLKQADQEFPRITYEEAVEILQGKKKVNGRTTLETIQEDYDQARKTIKEKRQEVEDYEERLQQPNLKKKKENHYKYKITRLKESIHELEEYSKNMPDWIESAKNFEHGTDFGGSDETVLTRLFESPVQVYNWPKGIKAFYMKENEENSDYVKGVDLLAPEGFGEIVGGGERETDEGKLVAQIKKHNLPMEAFEWYLDLRRYGSVEHSGFGLGLERFIAWICNKHHVRETIPFPRMYGRLFP